MSSQRYNVPTVLPDLRREESYMQIVDSLEYLNAVADDIFNRITNRVAEDRDKLVGINGRINVAQAKIDKLRSSSTKATHVFSSPKYPAPQRTSEYQSIFSDVNPLLQKVRKNRTNINSRLPEVTKDTIMSKKDPFVFLMSTNKGTGREVSGDPEEGEGLGSLPRYLPSVSSLLLFNTSENPYKKYIVLDPLAGATTKTRDKVIEEENALSEAPMSILQGEELMRGTKDSVMYVPIMTELPELDVPTMLPDLPHVADDLFYAGDSGQSIAPSLANTSMPELPNLADPDALAATSAAPPTQPSLDSNAAAEVTLPPPAPPPVQEQPFAAIESEDESSEQTAVGGDDGGRANLMAAIRDAGGAGKAKLKKADRKLERKAKKEEEALDTGGSLLDDLSAALGRRRKAMSGKDKNKEDGRGGGGGKEAESHNLGGGSMMDNISRLIPAPKTANSDGGGSDDGSVSDEGNW